MTPEELAKLPDDVLDMAIEIKTKQIGEAVTNEFEKKIIEKSDKIIKELGCSDVYEALDKIKEDDFIIEAENSLIKEYGVKNIDEVLVIQREKLSKLGIKPKKQEIKIKTKQEEKIDFTNGEEKKWMGKVI